MFISLPILIIVIVSSSVSSLINNFIWTRHINKHFTPKQEGVKVIEEDEEHTSISL